MLRFLKSFNVFRQCRELDVPLWSCPQFLFLVMGIVIIGTVVLTYYIGQQYVSAELVALIVTLLTGFLFVVSYVIVQAFEQVVITRQRELQQSKKIIKLKDQFVFIAAHELRTPANAIKWGLSSLITAIQDKDPELYEEQKKLLNILDDSNERLLFLVRDLLEVARIENQTVKVKKELVHIRESLNDACEELAGMFEEYGVSLHNDIQEDMPAIAADPMRLKEIFINLISNATKYNKAGGNVWVSAETDASHLIVHVADDGMGISMDEQEHVFEKFWRAKQAEEYEGSGLGLFITKRLIELMDGDIWFTSTPGEGTTFSFAFSIADAVATEQIEADKEGDANTAGSEDSRQVL